MSDNELRTKLTDLGYFPGPITDSTREVYRKLYEKKAASLEDSTNQPPTSSTKQLVHRGADVSPPRTPPLPEPKTESSLIIALQDSGVSSKCNNGELLYMPIFFFINFIISLYRIFA